MTNAELIQKAQGLLVKMAKLVEAHSFGKIEIAEEVVPIDAQTKNSMKQRFNAYRVDVIKALNDVNLQ